MRLKDAVKQISKLSIAASELYKAKDRRYYEDAHEEWLLGNWPDNLSNFTWFRSCLLNVPSESSKVTHRSVQQVPAY